MKKMTPLLLPACLALALGSVFSAAPLEAAVPSLPEDVAHMERVMAENRDAPASLPGVPAPLLLLLAAVAAPVLAGAFRAGARTVREAARKLPRPAFCAGVALAVTLFCGADKFPTNPVQSITGALQGLGPGQPPQMPTAPAIPLSQSGTAETGAGGSQQQGGSETGTGETSQQGTQGAPPPGADAFPFVRETDIYNGPPAPESFLTNWIVSGIAQSGVTRNIGSAFASAPSNAVRHAGWQRYGVAEDWFTAPSPAFGLVAEGGDILPPDWNFPFGGGTTSVSKAHIASSGFVSFDAVRERLPRSLAGAALAAPLAGIPLGLAPDLGSEFWMDTTACGSARLTWRNAFADRDTNMPVSIQAELFPDGEMAFRYHAPAHSGILALPSLTAGAWRAGGGDAVTFDPAALAGGLELRWRAFSDLNHLKPDQDSDGLTSLDEIFIHGTSPYRPDTDFDGLGETNELALGTSPLDPDTDLDLAADSIDPEPLTFNNPTNIPACCTNTWLFHVHNGLPTDGSAHAVFDVDTGLLSSPPMIHIRVTLHAPVPAPGAVLRVADVPLIMRDPGAWDLWLDASDILPITLHRQRDVPADYTITSDTPGFVLFSDGSGLFAAMPAIKVSSSVHCIHTLNSAITFKAEGSAVKLPGQFVWTYGNTTVATVITDTPELTIPDSSNLGSDIHVSFTPAAAPGRHDMAAAAGGSWPTAASARVSYCEFAHSSSGSADHWWCELTRTFTIYGCRAAAGGGTAADWTGWGGAGGTNRLGIVPVSRRDLPWPLGYATYLPSPQKAAAGAPPSPPPQSGGGANTANCGHRHLYEHDSPCPQCWAWDGVGWNTPTGDGHNHHLHPFECMNCAYWSGHWHRREKTFDHGRPSGCCSCPAHNTPPAAGAPPPADPPVIFNGASGVAVSVKSWQSDSMYPASPGRELRGTTLAAVTGVTPSHAPNDRTAHFSREDPAGTGETFHETDHFTVMSLDLWPDANHDGAVTLAGDSDALAPNWDRTWVIPGGGTTAGFWKKLQVFNDVALPGTYRVDITGGASNICVRHGGTSVWAGQADNAVSFPPGSTVETLEVGVFAGGDATLTVSFAGAGSSSNYTRRAGQPLVTQRHERGCLPPCPSVI